MRLTGFGVLVVFLAGLVCSCATMPVQWEYEKDAIKLNIKADPKLNLRGNKGHKLAICVYQLRDPSQFNQLKGNEQGLFKLLECTNFDSSSIACSRFFVDPGKNLVKALDRAEGAKYVAVVAGYYKLDKDKVTALAEIKQVSKRYGFLKTKKKTVPAELQMDLNFGPIGIIRK
jgi:type VI secretion system VasD/TssJ family lipoprotein